MILRRFSDALRGQDWVTVLIETLIVVFGVFIGLQVNNWNAARADHKLGQDYVFRLVVDLEKDLASQRGVSGYYTQVLASVEAADALLSIADPDPEELVAAVYRATEFSTDPINQATWEQIVSSGHLGLLPSTDTANRLSNYYKYQDAMDETISLLQRSPYRLAVRSLVPLTVQIAIREGCSDVLSETNVITGFVADCRLEVDQALLQETAETLMSSSAVRETLRHQYSMVSSALNNTNGNIFAIERLISELAGAGHAP